MGALWSLTTLRWAVLLPPYIVFSGAALHHQPAVLIQSRMDPCFLVCSECCSRNQDSSHLFLIFLWAHFSGLLHCSLRIVLLADRRGGAGASAGVWTTSTCLNALTCDCLNSCSCMSVPNNVAMSVCG